MAKSEIDRLDPEPNLVDLQSGTTVEVVPLKARQFFRLLRVLTHGAGAQLLKNDLNFNGPSEEFMTKLLSLILLSIPDAENEAVDFIQSMCKPTGLVERPGKLTKEDLQANAELWDNVAAELYNPELEDIIDVVEAIIKAEADDIQALGKRLSRFMEMADKMGQTKPAPAEETPDAAALTSPETPSEASSPDPSTSSPASTDGPTNTSSGSPSAGSGKSRTRSRAASSELAGSSAS